MSYAGFYINLARSPERRKEIEQQLERYGLQHRYRRLDATNGALGCAFSMSSRFRDF